MARLLRSLVVLIWATHSLAAPPAFEIRENAELIQTPAGYFKIQANLGNLPPSSEGTVSLTVKNPFNSDIVFGNHFNGCACLKATLSDAVLKKNGSITIDLHLKIPSKANSTQQVAAINFSTDKEGQSDTVSLIMHYELNGLIAFVDNRAVGYALESEKDLQLQLPMIVGRDVKEGDIIFKAKGALVGLQVRLENEGDRYFAKASMPTKHLNELGLTGEITVENVKSGKRDSILCSLLLQAPVTVAPEPLWLTWSEKDKAYHGSLMVCANDFKSHENAATRTSEVAISATSKGAQVDCVNKQLGNGLVKTRLKITPEKGQAAYETQDNTDGLFVIASYHRKKEIKKVQIRFSTVIDSLESSRSP